MRIIFWIGQEYFNCYLTDENFQDTKVLVSEDMINKLVYVYDRSNLTIDDEEDNQERSIVKLERKTIFCVEGHEDPETVEYF